MNLTATTLCEGVLTYHSTKVAIFKDGKLTLNSGGYRTVTTKRRINQAFKMFGIDAYLYQKGNVWYVDKDGKTLEFFNGMTV